MANANTSLNGYEFGRSPRTQAPFWGGSGEGAEIDDTVTVTDKTWSSKKISDELAEKADTSDLVNYAKVTSVYSKSESYSKAEVDALIEEIPSVDAYTKTQTDNLLADKANASDLVNYAKVTSVYSKSESYSKAEVDALIEEIPSVDAYTKAQTDNLLADKANASDVYTKTETDSLLANKAGLNAVYTKGQTDRLLSDKANASDVYTKTQTDNLLTGYAKSTSVYTKSQTYTKTEVDNLISQSGGETGVKRFILKPYEISGIQELFGAESAFTHQSYKFELLITGMVEKFPIILTKGDGSTIKVEFSGYELLPWNENDTNSVYTKADAVYRKFSVGGMDFGICFTGNHLIDNRYYPDVIIAVDASLDIASIAINTTDYTFKTFGIGESYSASTPESLFRDYDAYPRKDEVWGKNYTQLVRYQEDRGLQYYQFYDNTWHNCLYTLDNEVHIFNDYKGSTLACSQFGNQVEFVIKLKSGVSFTANQKVQIGWCSRDPIGVDGIKINGFVYDDSTYLNINGASCLIYKHSGDSDIYLVFNSNYITTGNEIIRFSYFIDVDS